MINITKEQLRELLSKSFDEGQCGYQDLKELFLDGLIEEFLKPVSKNEVKPKKIDQFSEPRDQTVERLSTDVANSMIVTTTTIIEEQIANGLINRFNNQTDWASYVGFSDMSYYDRFPFTITTTS